MGWLQIEKDENYFNDYNQINKSFTKNRKSKAKKSSQNMIDIDDMQSLRGFIKPKVKEMY